MTFKFGGFGTTKPVEVDYKLTQDQRNMKLDQHVMYFNEQAEIQKIEYENISKIAFDQDKKNYMMNKQIEDFTTNIADIEEKQQQQQEVINAIASKQNQLFQILQKLPVSTDHPTLIALGQTLLQCQQLIEQYDNIGLPELKKINELSNYLDELLKQFNLK